MLLNFRLFAVTMTSDLKKMFLQINLCTEHRKFQRILWRFSPEEPLAVYQFDRVIFGLRPSPYLACRTVKQLASNEAETFPLASKVLENDIYIDDFITSVPSLEKSVTLYYELVGLFRAGGFELVKWCTNSTALLENIPEQHRLLQTVEFSEDSVFSGIRIRIFCIIRLTCLLVIVLSVIFCLL